MDTKLKNNKRNRAVIAAGVIFFVTFVNLLCFPVMNRRVNTTLDSMETETYTNDEFINSMYYAAYVLYMESNLHDKDYILYPHDLFLDEEKSFFSESGYTVNEISKDEVYFEIDSKYEEMEDCFSKYRYRIDYYATDGNNSEKNTDRLIEAVLESNKDSENGTSTLEELKEFYRYYFILEFNENGELSVSLADTDEVLIADMLIKAFQQAEHDYSMQKMLSGIDTSLVAKEIRNFKVVFGVPEADDLRLATTENYFYEYNIINDVAIGPYFISMMIMLLLAIFLTSRKVWDDISSYHRTGKWYTLELAVTGIICTFSFEGLYVDFVRNYAYKELGTFFSLFMQMNGLKWLTWFSCFFCTALLYAMGFVSFCAIRPAFSLGIKQYIREYSFFYQIFPWMKKHWKKFLYEIDHINFTSKSTKTIMKIVIVNAILVSVLTFMWVAGIVGVIIYSVLLFFILKHYYDKIAVDYSKVMEITNRMADGDLDTEIEADLGVFEPIKDELGKIRSGFKQAVEQEVKSQRMKTELITNVSHDLKTPLTAITTYVELLKKEDITEEERRSYIDTLSRKSLRLKVLIEDLFEVSKANSENVVLDLMDVDVVNLMKQVSIEHVDKLQASGIELRWNVPEEKMISQLDNQKTYRIFENLFVNIQKYAMPNSRVYIDVTKEEGKVWITMKNMSAVELNVRPEELTERFVRGDKSRNTEGSGLGLAIAKSFTEAQNGTFEIEVDGDLFKANLSFTLVSKEE